MVLFITTSNGFAGPKKRGNDTEETTTFSSPHYRVYLLQDDLESFSSALKDNEYEEVSCLINKGYRWYRLDKTETTPGFWPLVSEGTGRDLTAENTFNKGEHWIYYMPTPRAKFAVCFGQGDFLKTRVESRLIDDRYGITDFGRKVVINLVREPKTISEERDTKAGKPFISSLPRLQGCDYLGFSKKMNLQELPIFCERLRSYYYSNNREIYDYFNKIRAGVDGAEKVDNSVALTLSTKAKDEEDSEIELDGQRYVKFYDEWYSLGDLYAQTIQETAELIDESEESKLPSFNEESYRDSSIINTSRLEVEDCEEDEASSKKTVIPFEGLYNEAVSRKLKFLLMDKRCVDGIEICDLYDSKAKRLIHVKIGTEGHKLNHLFGQGNSSTEMLGNPEFRRKAILELIKKRFLETCRSQLQIRWDAQQEGLLKRIKEWKIVNQDKIKGTQKSKRPDSSSLAASIEELQKQLDENLTQSSKISIKEKLAALKKETRSSKIKEQLVVLEKDIDTVKPSIEKINAVLKEILEFLRPKPSKTKSIREKAKEPDLSKIGDPLYDIHKQLTQCKKESVFKADAELAEIIEALNSFRFDLIANTMNDIQKGILELDTEPEERTILRELKWMPLCNAWRDGIERKREIKSRILKESIGINAYFRDVFTRDLEEEFDLLASAFIPTPDFKSDEHTVTYAIVAPRDTKPIAERITLGPRLNLLLYANSMKTRGFKVNVVFVDDETPAHLKSTSSFSIEAVTEGAASALPLKSQKKAKAKPSTNKKARMMEPEDSELNIETLFVNAKELAKPEDLDLGKSQKFSVKSDIDPLKGIYGEYISCSTAGTGDCFFHAVFTQNGEYLTTMKTRAEEMRATLCNTVLDENYFTGCRNILYEEYLEFSSTPKEVRIPEPMRKMFRENHDHIAARNYVQSILLPGQELPSILASEYRHSTNSIKTEITVDCVRSYMERFRTNTGYDSYIPARQDMVCPVDALAHQNNVRINVFTFNKESLSLQVLKTAGELGASGNNPVHNILLADIHYVALFNPAESNRRKESVKQIMKNAGVI